MNVLTIKEVSARTSLSARTIYRMIDKGTIGLDDTFLVGNIRKKRVITEQWVEDFINKNRRYN